MASAEWIDKSLEERVDDLGRTVSAETSDLKVAVSCQMGALKEQIAGLRTGLEMSLGLTKWIGGYATAIIVAMLVIGWQVPMDTARLDAKVSALEQRIDKLERRVDHVELKLDEILAELRKLKSPEK